MLQTFRAFAQYNQQMNKQFYQAASELSVDELKKDRQVFFGSIWKTFNHLMVGDLFWLRRFATHFPELSTLDSLDAFPMQT